MIKVVKDEWTPFVANLGKMPNILMPIVGRTMTNIVKIWIGQARKWAYFKTKAKPQGQYANSFYHMGPRKSGKKWYIDWGNEAKHAGGLEFGNPPHIIRPRADRSPASVLATRGRRATGHKAALAWVGAGGGMIFAKYVNHPGNKAYHLIEGSGNDSHTMALIKQEISKQVDGQINKLTKRGQI